MQEVIAVNKKKSRRDALRALALITQLGLNMLVPIVLCFFLGRWLDDVFHTGFLLPVFIILGILAAYRNMYESTKTLLKGERECEDEAYRKKSESARKKNESDTH